MKMQFYLLLLLIACSSPQKGKVLSSIESVQAEIIGHQIEELKQINFSVDGRVLSVIDTVFEDEDQTWNGLVYYLNNSLLLTAETSWSNKQNISRVTINDPSLKTKENLGVGSSFESIESAIQFQTWKDFPDGYVAFKDASDEKIIYMMDVNGHPELTEGALIKDKVPSSLKVQSIVLMK